MELRKKEIIMRQERWRKTDTEVITYFISNIS